MNYETWMREGLEIYNGCTFNAPLTYLEFVTLIEQFPTSTYNFKTYRP
jgi:hypothetical protein